MNNEQNMNLLPLFQDQVVELTSNWEAGLLLQGEFGHRHLTWNNSSFYLYGYITLSLSIPCY